MSGICGIIRFDDQIVKKEEMQKMLDAMQNRGNDMEGIWVDGNVGFGHKMLWTTPESLHENQPFLSENSNFLITADVRIDNRDELFKQFEIDENGFDVVTDISLLLRAYEKWGEECPKYLLGDFAFAILDKIKKKIFFAKDHIGIRPLYYYFDKHFFCFSSEISPIFSISDIKKLPSYNSMKTFLKSTTLKYDKTFYENIRRMSPAHRMVLNKGKIKISRYWFPEAIHINKSITFQEASKQFRTLLQKAVYVRLRSAYPVGCALSGGLDSSSILCIAAEYKLSNSLTPFSLRYGSFECDESYYSNIVANSLNMDVQMIHVDKLDYEKEYTLKNYLQEFPDWPTYGSFMGTLPLAKKVQSQNIRVYLTGQGGDHVAAGNLFLLADYLKTFQLKKLYQELSHLGWSKYIIKKYIIRPNVPKFIIKVRDILIGKKREYILEQTSLFKDIDLKNKPLSFREDLGYISDQFNAFWTDSTIYHNIEKFNIESRHPYFDIRLVEFCLSLPAEYKFKDGISKRILREALKEVLPEEIRMRKDKAEFSSIVKKQLDFEYNEEDLVCLKKIINYDIITKNRSVPILWKYVGLEKWYKRNFDEK